MDKSFKMKVGAGIAALAVIVTGGGWYYCDNGSHSFNRKARR